MRKKIKIKKRTAYDPRYNDPFVGKFINHLMRDGKKETAQKVLYGAFELITKRTKKDALAVFNEALKNVAPMVEVISRRIGGANYQIPRDVQGDRRVTLAMRWIIEVARKKKGKSMKEKLAEELTAASKKEGDAVKKREEIHRVAAANRAFAHFARR